MDIQPQDTFTLFPRLPLELQLHVINLARLALPKFRVLELTTVHHNLPHQMNTTFRIRLVHEGNGLDGHSSIFAAIKSVTPFQNPTFLQISKDLRLGMLKHYDICTPEGSSFAEKSILFFDFSRDVFSFNSNLDLSKFTEVPYIPLERLAVHTEPTMSSEVPLNNFEKHARHIIIRGITYDEAQLRGLGRYLRRCQSLKTIALWISPKSLFSPPPRHSLLSFLAWSARTPAGVTPEMNYRAHLAARLRSEEELKASFDENGRSVPQIIDVVIRRAVQGPRDMCAIPCLDDL